MIDNDALEAVRQMMRDELEPIKQNLQDLKAGQKDLKAGQRNIIKRLTKIEAVQEY